MGEGAALDLTILNEAITSKDFSKIADICDQLMLQVASDGIPFQDEWPYSAHLLGHIYVNDINSARFLWKSIPMAVKERQPEIVAAWRIAQKLWARDYIGVYQAIAAHNWSPHTKDLVEAFSDLYVRKMFQLLASAYSIISIKDTALFLGMSEDAAAKRVVEVGWTVDASSGMVTVTKHPVVCEQKLGASNLQRLTEYVFHLEH